MLLATVIVSKVLGQVWQHPPELGGTTGTKVLIVWGSRRSGEFPSEGFQTWISDHVVET